MARRKYFRKNGMKAVDYGSVILLEVGGFNWFLAKILNWNLVEKLLGTGFGSDVVYVLVGVSAGYILVRLFQKKIRIAR